MSLASEMYRELKRKNTLKNWVIIFQMAAVLLLTLRVANHLEE